MRDHFLHFVNAEMGPAIDPRPRAQQPERHGATEVVGVPIRATIMVTDVCYEGPD